MDVFLRTNLKFLAKFQRVLDMDDNFTAFGLNTERYGVSLHIQSECGKIRTRKIPNTDAFHAVRVDLYD